MLFEGCQSKSRDLSLAIKICPECGSEVEVFSTDVEVACDSCGFMVYNEATSCVQWCRYARQCVGDEMYAKWLAISEMQDDKREGKGALDIG